MGVYDWFFRTVLSRMDPERAHSLAATVIRGLRPIRTVVYPWTRPARALQVHTLGVTFPSPFGLAAGFDKDARCILGLGALGFGHVEVGTLTALAQDGNPRPRLFRLVADRALVNRMGFNNAGSMAAVPRLRRARQASQRPVVGVNIGKSRATELDDAVADYVTSTHRVAGFADYLAVNVSSPNTPGLRGLQELEQLRPLLEAVQRAAGKTPVLVKIAPDMADEHIDGIVDLVIELGLSGLIATNTTVSREGLRTPIEQLDSIGDGGVSGEPLKERSLEVLKRIRARAPEDLCVISVGGVTTAQDVAERLAAGATLVQGYTAFIYEGPLWACRINRGLAKLRARSS